MKRIPLPSGELVPALGIGTWRMGESRTTRAEEIATLRMALERGASLIDTAEMYGEGATERLVGEAIAGGRDRVFLVSKVYPHNASRKRMPTACEQSLARLKTDRIDLYLLHWRGSVPFAETLEAFERLREAGKIRYYGVSNIDLRGMHEIAALARGGAVATDQVLYNLTRRGIERDLLPYLRERHIPVMAYSPLDEGRLLENPVLNAFAKRARMSSAQVALARLLAEEGVIVIPKTGNRRRLEENLDALERPLSDALVLELDQLFPAPESPVPLEML